MNVDTHPPLTPRFSTRRPLSLGLRVYLAEDDPDMRALLVEELSSLGCDVTEASDGDEMLRLLSGACILPESRPDAIVMDVRMPYFTGLELLRAMREAGWDVPVVLVSGFGDPTLRQAAERLGAVTVLAKPFDTDDLGTVLANLAPRR